MPELVEGRRYRTDAGVMFTLGPPTGRNDWGAPTHEVTTDYGTTFPVEDSYLRASCRPGLIVVGGTHA